GNAGERCQSQGRAGAFLEIIDDALKHLKIRIENQCSRSDGRRTCPLLKSRGWCGRDGHRPP
ncbi:MAG: hypothetical protein ACRD9W_19070, partial [Terriglobia bacterium]